MSAAGAGDDFAVSYAFDFIAFWAKQLDVGGIIRPTQTQCRDVVENIGD